MTDWNTSTVAAFAAVSLLMGLALLWMVRRQPSRAEHGWEGVEALLNEEPAEEAARAPHVLVSTGEFAQVLRAEEGNSQPYFEPTMNFRVRLSNHGSGPALDIRGRVSDDAGSYWMTSGRIDLAEKSEEREIVLHSVYAPPVGQDQVTWLQIPLRLEYQDVRGGEWFTQVDLRLKIVRNNATNGYACWWVDVIDSDEHGKLVPDVPSPVGRTHVPISPPGAEELQTTGNPPEVGPLTAGEEGEAEGEYSSADYHPEEGRAAAS